MIMILTMVFCLCMYLSVTWWKGRHHRRLDEALGKNRIAFSFSPGRFTLAKLRMPTMSPVRRNILIAIGPAVAGALFCVSVLHLSPAFGLVLGGIAPFIAISTLQNQRMKAYRRDAKSSLEFASAVFGAGGTVQEWVQEVVPRLEGPLHDPFAKAGAQLRQNIPVGRFLERLATKSPDAFFRWAAAGILMNERSAGDLQKFIAEVMDDLQTQERLERMMKQEQKSSNNMLMAMIAFPGLLFLGFHSTINAILARHWEANLVLMIGLGGYVALFLFASKITKPQVFTS